MQNEARIMTDEDTLELEEGQFVWVQFKNHGLYCMEIVGIIKNDHFASYIQFNTPNEYIEVDMRKNTCRLWTNQPAEEQMDEVEWE